MGFLNELISVRCNLRGAYIALVKKYGNNGELDTFNICSDYDLRLDDRKIDKMKLSCGTIIIYYSENECDFNLFRNFDIEDLAQFYDGLAKVVEYEKEYKQSL